MFHLIIKFKFMCFTIFSHSSRLSVFAAKYKLNSLTICNGTLGEKSFRKRKGKAFANKFDGAHNAFCWAAAATRHKYFSKLNVESIFCEKARSQVCFNFEKKCDCNS